MKRKLFEYSKQGLKQLEEEYPNSQQVLTIIRDGKIYITNGDNLTEEEKREYKL